MAEAVFFDFGGTLDADGRSWGERLHQGYRAAGGKLALDRFEGYFRESDRRMERRAGIGRLGFRDTVSAQVGLLRRMIPDAKALDGTAWVEGFLADATAMARRNLPLLARLGRRFELGIISNFTGNLRPCLQELGLEDCFEVVFDSAVVGIRKPDRRIFGVACESLGRLPEECWMIGDNPFVDIAPAAAVGCATCWLAPAGRALPPDVAPTRRISALPELAGVLA